MPNLVDQIMPALINALVASLSSTAGVAIAAGFAFFMLYRGAAWARNMIDKGAELERNERYAELLRDRANENARKHGIDMY